MLVKSVNASICLPKCIYCLLLWTLWIAYNNGESKDAMKIQEIRAITIMNKSKLPEAAYCINPYVGCSHRCVYCYARFMRRFTVHQEA